MARLHASCIALDGAGVLLRGPSGAGKSDLALRLIDRGAILIADDQVLVCREGARLVATAPEPIAGMLEVRGLGIVRTPRLLSAALVLAVDLVPREMVERMPSPGRLTIDNVEIACVALNPFECSAAAKVRLAASAAASDINLCLGPASPSAGFAFS